MVLRFFFRPLLGLAGEASRCSRAAESLGGIQGRRQRA
jgi:hypothetical protein